MLLWSTSDYQTFLRKKLPRQKILYMRYGGGKEYLRASSITIFRKSMYVYRNQTFKVGWRGTHQEMVG